jgi:hypothetical protein
VWGKFDIFAEEEGIERLIAAAALPTEAPAVSAGPSNASEPTRAQKPLSKKRLAGIGAAYVESEPDRPSMADFERFARDDHGVTGHQEKLRNEYRRRYPDRTVGRPTKKPLGKSVGK